MHISNFAGSHTYKNTSLRFGKIIDYNLVQGSHATGREAANLERTQDIAGMASRRGDVKDYVVFHNKEGNAQESVGIFFDRQNDPVKEFLKEKETTVPIFRDLLNLVKEWKNKEPFGRVYDCTEYVGGSIDERTEQVRQTRNQNRQRIQDSLVFHDPDSEKSIGVFFEQKDDLTKLFMEENLQDKSFGDKVRFVKKIKSTSRQGISTEQPLTQMDLLTALENLGSSSNARSTAESSTNKKHALKGIFKKIFK